MHGRNKRSASYHAMAVFVLGCAYFALTPLSALAQGAGGKGVSVTVNPTTGYSVINSKTIGTPRGTTVGPSGGTPSVTVRTGGGLSQSLPAGIEITGLRQNAQTLRGTLGASLNATAGALRTTATRCLSSFRCTNVLSLTAIGLQQLLDTADWELGPDGRPSGVDPSYSPFPDSETGGDFGWLTPAMPGEYFYSPDAGCDVYIARRGNVEFEEYQYYPGGERMQCRFKLQSGSVNVVEFSLIGRNNLECPPGYSFGAGNERFSCRSDSPAPRVPVSPSDIPDIVDQNYTPHPSDWNWLSGGMDFSDPGFTIDITDLPVLDGSNEPNFIQNSDGTSRGTFNIYTPTARYNGTSKPEIEVHDEQTETSYDNQGNPTGSSTSTGVMTPNPGGSPSSPDIVIPTDCDFMPTVCRFIDWFTEPDIQPDPDQEIRDLVQVYEDGGREVTVGPESGSCPAPRIIELSLVPSVEFSFQPFCDLATAVRFWLLAIASFGAAYMTVRSI